MPRRIDRSFGLSKNQRLLILSSIGGTLAVGLIILNFATSNQHVKTQIKREYSVNDPEFRRTMSSMLEPEILAGNKVETLVNGDEIFPAMLQAIHGARKSINFETFIYWSAPIGKDFADALADRSRSGVKVHVLLDWLGSNKIDKNYVAEMQRAGVEVLRYRPLRWYSAQSVNKRSHRKILVVDGRIGFTGGVGIAAEWTGHAQDPDHWRDSHYRVEGPVVAQMQGDFIDHWTQTTGKVLHGSLYFPALEPAGTIPAQMFSTSPSQGESMEFMYLLAITAAEHSIYLSSAYFVPDQMTQDALSAAVGRGVKVQIIAPGKHTDQSTVRRASRSRWGDMLKAGVEIYEYQPTMYHCKVMIVDDLFVTVGSTNFDPRSFGLNDEANLNVYDAAFARQQIAIFQKDLALSQRMTYEQWQQRPFLEKIWERLASIFGRAL